ncbi:MAG: DnaD domain protein [Anaerolineales bacterium]|jgi:DnaD/phage-associated family protein
MPSSKGFAGFPQGKLKVTPIPQPFFSELLPAIDHLGELKVTLYAFWALARKQERFQYLRREDMAADALFLGGMAAAGMSPGEALDEALERAVARGTLLQVWGESEKESQAYFFLNTPKGRAAVKAIAEGHWRPSGDPEAPIELSLERPNIFNLYEQNIGPLTPMIAESLREAERSFPADWIEQAIRIAVENNVRKWRYVQAILDDWRARGKDEREDRADTEKARRCYLEGEFDGFIEP